MSYQDLCKNLYFSSVLNHDFGQKFKFFPQSILFQNCFDMRFDGGLGKKLSLFRLQKCHFKIRENLKFSKGLTHDFCQKCKISSAFVSLSKGPCFDV